MSDDFQRAANNVATAFTAGASIGEGLLASSEQRERKEKHHNLMDAISGIDSVLIQLNALEERIGNPVPINQTETSPDPDFSTLEAVLDHAPEAIRYKSEKALQLIESIKVRLF